MDKDGKTMMDHTGERDMGLAIEGGRPVRPKPLSYGRQWIEDDDVESVVRTLRSDYLTQGPKIAEFEQKMADDIGVQYAVAFTNGTSALHAACYAAGVSPGDEVITTPITFVASANCALYLGAKPVFADIDDRTYNMDPGKMEQAITSRTKAIIPVDFTGQPADMDEMMRIARKHGLIVIEDAAHSLGATYRGRRTGTLADMTMFSFHPVKHITTGEGGIIVTDSPIYAEKLRLFRSHGITKTPTYRDEGPWYYEMTHLGYNYRMTDIQAALGLSQLNKLDRFVGLRRNIARVYNEALSELPGVTTPWQLPGTESSWHLYVLRLKLPCFSVSRRRIFEALRAENIIVHVHYIPVYLQPYYQELGYRKGSCAVAEQWYEEAITLPLFPKMEREDMDSVIAAVRKVLTHYYTGS